ncbi:MAG: papain-like cysteine protease family protein [Oscillospiraceae bacterium]
MKKHLLKRLTAGVLVSVMCFFINTASAALNTYYIGLESARQAKSQWCWAASLQVMLAYYGIHKLQANIVIDVKGANVNDGATFDEIINYFQKQTKKRGVLYGRALTKSEIVSEIGDYKRPISVQWSYKLGGAHNIVIYGYENNADLVYYNEPDTSTGDPHKYLGYNAMKSTTSRTWLMTYWKIS